MRDALLRFKISLHIRRSVCALAGPALFVMVVFLSGCAAWVTYPPIEGAAHLGHARLEPVPSIMADAIRYSNDRFVKMDEIVFNLPEGAPPRVYRDVATRMRGGRPMREGDTMAIHIAEVRVRALDAEVDVIYPRADGHHEMVTLYMRQKILHNYEVQSTRLWRIHVDAPPPHYVEPDRARDGAASEVSGDDGGA